MTIKKTLLGAASVAALAFAASAAPAAAEDREFGWSITVGGTSDYIFRGLSFTNENPAAQGSIDMTYGIFYAGAWGSNIDNFNYEPWELDLYAGIKPVLGPVTFDFGAVYYLYPAASVDLEYVELKAGASMELLKGLTGGATFWYTPSQSNFAETYTIEGLLSYALPQMGIFSPTLSGGVGYSEDQDGKCPFFCNGASVDPTDPLYVADYVYWNAGITLGVEKFSMDFRYWDTNVSTDESLGLADERFVFTAKVTLP